MPRLVQAHKWTVMWLNSCGGTTLTIFFVKPVRKIFMQAEASSEYYFAIPQIDWEHISDNLLWKAGNYDDVVLSEMGLKWNADKTIIIKDE